MKRFFGKSTSSSVNDTTHTLKPTQMVQSVSRKWQLLHFTLKTLMTPQLRDGSSVFNAELEGLHLALKKFLTLYKSRKNFIVYTDSFSAVESLRGKSYRAKNIKRFYNLLKKIATASPGGHSMDPLTCGHFWKRKS